MENIRIEGQIYNIIYSNANGFKIMTVNSEGKIYTVKRITSNGKCWRLCRYNRKICIT